MMKKLFTTLLFWSAITLLSASDTLFVKSPYVPILINRNDNILLQMRIEAKEKNNTFNGIQIRFNNESNLKDIKSVRLYYGGVEATTNKKNLYQPTYFLSSNSAKGTHKANLSYSVLQDECKKANNTIELKSKQILPKGINYFWVSIEMKKRALLTGKIGASVTDAKLNDQKISIVQEGVTDTRRLGIGVRQGWDDNVAAFRIPGLTTTNKGTLIGVYDIRYNSSVDLQEKVDIGVSRSTDGGKSWEPMRIAMTMGETMGLPHAQNGVGDPAVLVDKTNNTIWVIAAWTHGMGNQRAWWNSGQGMEPDETAQLMLAKSTDDGKTWSQPINITQQVKDPSWFFLLQGPGKGICMHDGTLVFPIQYIKADRIPSAGIMYSKDHGETWHIHKAARDNTTESQVAEIEPGTLMLNMRDNRGGSRAVSITKDLGKTWEEHASNRKALQEPICMGSLLKIEAEENYTGKPILLFSNPNSKTKRNNITIKASLDNGESWPEKFNILLDEEDGWGYSCLTLIDKETVGILYESSVAHMTFQAIPLKEILEKK